MTVGLLHLITIAHAATPILFHRAGYQSPTHADPDDLLLLAGDGLSATDTVIYQLLDKARNPNAPPKNVPTGTTSLIGQATVISNLGAPHSLTVRLPETMLANQSYALWVHTRDGEWSNPVTINDARPFWVTPAFVYSGARLASLPRYLKVVGRNLRSRSSQTMRVRLSGPQTLVVQATEDEHPHLDEYVARIALPEGLPVGSYGVAVSRDGGNWIALADQTLQVRPDPIRSTEYRVDDALFGHCRANDGVDDAPCIQRAIAAAQRAGGGTIYFDAGVWDLIDANAIGLMQGDGIRLPPNIKLQGAGLSNTTLMRHPQWNAEAAHPAFSLIGNNEIRGFRFADVQRYTTLFQAAAFLQLGWQDQANAKATATHWVTDVVITDNLFDRPSIAISDVGLPISNLFITYNEFGAYHAAIRLVGNRFNMLDEFRIDDSVIAYNRFYPGSWLDQANRQGAVASELGAGYRLDFSDNEADGAAVKYLNSVDDARGWRAAFFWHLSGNQEKLLISANVATCTGDKIGDGEAIAFDNNGNNFAFDVPKAVIRATSHSVTVPGSLLATQNDRQIPIASYYNGHWLQIGAGAGLGQVRKIISYSIDPHTQAVTFDIAPAWDVVPQAATSQLSVGREFWQAYIIGNSVDHRKPSCLKSNRSDSKGGVIGIWAQTADSVLAGNRTFDTDGISFHSQFTAKENACADCYRGNHYVSFVEIRDNSIEGEYDWDTDCSSSGIAGSLAASPGTPPLTVNYGLIIAHNIIDHADAKLGGAIAMTPAWYNGPAPHRWPLVDASLIYHNTINGMWSGRARACRKQATQPRTAFSFASSLVWRTVLYANRCEQAPRIANLDGAQQLTRLCKPGMPNACECLP